mmetsp:Transcript_19766/g.44879  ORF Transcript_19766/g.44879 Transcript_19766/m.44879 type:complete len:359 (+) Transcript_19766:435-1511(+)
MRTTPSFSYSSSDAMLSSTFGGRRRAVIGRIVTRVGLSFPSSAGPKIDVGIGTSVGFGRGDGTSGEAAGEDAGSFSASVEEGGPDTFWERKFFVMSAKVGRSRPVGDGDDGGDVLASTDRGRCDNCGASSFSSSLFRSGGKVLSVMLGLSLLSSLLLRSCDDGGASCFFSSSFRSSKLFSLMLGLSLLSRILLRGLSLCISSCNEIFVTNSTSAFRRSVDPIAERTRVRSEFFGVCGTARASSSFWITLSSLSVSFVFAATIKNWRSFRVLSDSSPATILAGWTSMSRSSCRSTARTTFWRNRIFISLLFKLAEFSSSSLLEVFEIIKISAKNHKTCAPSFRIKNTTTRPAQCHLSYL